MTIPKPKNLDDYISDFPPDVREILEQVRETVRQAAPDAEETIKYDMPAFVLHGNLVYFAAFKNHIGFYPAPTGIPEFEKDLSVYKTGKGSVQFPFNKPMPLRLIARIVKWRIKKSFENMEKKR
jgi:uncharacterized protein YdhG (YjbR/CyaY superfamily)